MKWRVLSSVFMLAAMALPTHAAYAEGSGGWCGASHNELCAVVHDQPPPSPDPGDPMHRDPSPSPYSYITGPSCALHFDGGDRQCATGLLGQAQANGRNCTDFDTVSYIGSVLVVDRATGATVERVVTCYHNGTPVAPTPTVPTWQDLWGQAESAVQVPSINVTPVSKRVLIGIPADLSTGPFQPITVTANDPICTETVTATPTSYAWVLDSASADAVVTTTPNYQFSYQTKGYHHAGVVVLWTGTYTMTCKGITSTTTGNLGAQPFASDVAVINVDEVRSILTN